jgi:uncharacterized membrane protein
MGKRSRKRTASSEHVATGAEAPGGTTRAERDAARARRAAGVRDAAAAPARAQRPHGRRAARGERPPAPWGSFPLVELCVLLSLVLLVTGFLVGGRGAAPLVLAGLAVGSLAGLELSIREHFAGFRSHTIVLAGAVAALVATIVAVAAGKIYLPILFGVAVIAFAIAFYLFRQEFRRRSGGLSFR